MAWVATTVVGLVGAGTALATTGASVGLALSGAGQPQYPNESASSAQMADTEANLLPIQRGMAAAAQTGGSYTFNLPAGASPGSLGIQTTGSGWYNPAGQMVAGPNDWFKAPGNGPTGSVWRPGQMTINGVPIKQNSDGSYTIDFSGMGTAQAEAAEAQQSAASQLALQQQYDPQFITTALAQEQQADPQSVAARNEMSNLVQQQANAPLNEPVSSMLNSQIQDTLNAAQNNTLTSTDTARLNAAVSDALGSRGGNGRAELPLRQGVGEFLTSGFPGEQRQAQAATSANNFLSSGSDPEDIEYRRTQQNLANLAAEANGQTPGSQFASLSGAANGPAPMAQGGQLPLLADNGAAAQQVGMQNWETQMQNANNQMNPWMAGLSGMLQLGSAISPRPVGTGATVPTLFTPANPAS